MFKTVQVRVYLLSDRYCLLLLAWNYFNSRNPILGQNVSRISKYMMKAATAT
jgi:hypothetical protein